MASDPKFSFPVVSGGSKIVDSLLRALTEMSEGAVAVDADAKITWLNDKYRALLGVAEGRDVIGRSIEEIIPHSQMREVVRTGKPIVLDIMDFGSDQFVVTRLPLHDEQGKIAGAVGFVLFDRLEYLKPLISKFERLQAKLSAAEAQLSAARRTRYSIANIIGVSPQIVELRQMARKLAQSASPALLLGETGTGKELLAQSIHAASNRASRPFVAVNMAALPEALIETEFFGVAPGAFSGAERHGRRGKLEIAHEGTLFLDEIGDLPTQLQPKLLRVLEEREFEPVGSNDVRRIDVRIIAATSRDLAKDVEAGQFRRDLYYRLNVLPVRLAPLRERTIDVRPLSEFLLEQICQAVGLRVRDIDPEAMAILESYEWPGNARELKNILERACLLADADVLTPKDFAPLLPADHSPAVAPASFARSNLPERIASVEREAILSALRESGGKKSAAARQLGISRSTLYEKLVEHGLSEVSTDNA